MRLGITMSTYASRFGPIVFSGEDWDANIRTIRELGYDGIDLFSHRLSDSEVEKIGSSMKGFGLTTTLLLPIWLTEGASFLSAPDDVERAAAVARYRSQIEIAARLGANMPIGFSRGSRQAGETDEAYQDRLADSLREASALGEACGVRLLLEPINRYETNAIHRVDEAMEFLEKHRLDSIGLLLDLFHMNIEERSFESAIRLAGPRIGEVHVSDSNRRAPGQGHLEFDRILGALAAVGFDGFLVVEAFPDPSPRQAAENAMRFLTRVLRAGSGTTWQPAG